MQTNLVSASQLNGPGFESTGLGKQVGSGRAGSGAGGWAGRRLGGWVGAQAGGRRAWYQCGASAALLH